VFLPCLLEAARAADFDLSKWFARIVFSHYFLNPFYAMFFPCIVLWLRVGDGNFKLLHDLMQLDILYLSTCDPVVHRSVLP